MGKFASALMLVGLISAPAAQASEALAMQSGCLGCHKTDVKLVGPAFKDIAAKYAGDAAQIDHLTSKVKSGSKPGEPLVWGGAMMPASPASEENIKGVIEWIMTLK
ncbi:MAG: c-type cytochrome [Candidatus Thiodiazotropha sp. (ex. Lucinisca nassula)]|nr:c-type cytochrome [Candidatus Thiodiazotropha sp. (ex. Lucinisca nassula)]